MSAVIQCIPANNPKYCLFIPWTRKEYLRDVLYCIDQLIIARSDFEVVFYIDSDDKDLSNALHSWAILQTQQGWNGLKLVKSGNPPPETFSPLPRRARITAMKEDSKQYISATEYVFGLEDDTVFPPNSFARLKDIFDKNPNTGFAQGVQMGRWGLNVIGAWRVDDIDNPTVMGTIAMPAEPDNRVPIDGGGFFCYLTPTDLYKAHEYYWHDECFSVDATYGLELRKKGYDCYMDTNIVCDHLTEQGKLIPNARNIVSIDWHKKGSRWVRDTTQDYINQEVS